MAGISMDGRLRGWSGRSDLEACAQDIAEGAVFFGGAAGFIDGGVVVVTGLDGKVFVAAVGEAPVGAAEKDVASAERSNRGSRRELVPTYDTVQCGVARGDGFTPAAEPGGVDFGGVDGKIADGGGSGAIIGIGLEAVAAAEDAPPWGLAGRVAGVAGAAGGRRAPAAAAEGGAPGDEGIADKEGTSKPAVEKDLMEGFHVIGQRRRRDSLPNSFSYWTIRSGCRLW